MVEQGPIQDPVRSPMQHPIQSPVPDQRVLDPMQDQRVLDAPGLAELAGSVDRSTIPVSALAYVGDAVYELYVRLHLLSDRAAPSGRLHQLSIRLVKAAAQAEAARRLLPYLTEAEEAVFKRGRNSDPGTIAKHSDPVTYRYATALETLVGYLYLGDESQRLNELMNMIFRWSSETAEA